MNEAFHYPPELMQLLIDAIPLLCRSKRDVLLFFRGAGVAESSTQDLFHRVQHAKESINKYEIVRTVLTRLNERADAAIRERREVVKRIVEFEDFSTCWPDDQLKAKGLVGEIRRIVDVKDSFTRMRQERNDERRERMAARETEIEKLNQRKSQLDLTKRDLYALFGESDVHSRGKSLEGVLNRLFDAYGILVRSAFSICGQFGEGVVEQIDGVIEFDGHLHFVEVKWWAQPLGVPQISEHIVRVYGRAESRAIIVSASSFTDPAVSLCRDALSQKVVTLCTLREVVTVLEGELDLSHFLRAKVNAAITHKNPFHDPIAAGEVKRLFG
jgi:hypothetical protein